MRLRELKEILEANVDGIKVKSKQVPQKKEYEVSNIRDLYESVMNISSFDFIIEEINVLEGMTYIFNNKSSTVVIDGTDYKKLYVNVDNIDMKVRAVISAISEAIPDQSENSVSIKLPDTTDLKGVSNYIKEIDTILNQSLIGEFQGTIKLQNFDTGSNWIEVILANKEAVVLLGSIVKGTYEFIKEEYLVWKQMKHKIETLNTDMAAKKLLLDAMKDSVNAKARSHAIAITKEFKITDGQAEYETGLTHSIVTLAELIYEGAEVHTALNAPEEAKEVYPDSKEIRKIISNTVKLLPEVSSDISVDNLETNEDDEAEESQADTE